MIELDLIKNGRVKTIHCIIEDGNNYFKNFITGWSERSDLGSLAAIIDRIAEHGPPRNPEKFRPLSKGIFEIKNSKIRITCFFVNDNINHGDLILIEGFAKPKERIVERYIKRGLHVKKQFESPAGGTGNE